MTARARVGLELVDSVLHYAAVEENESALRLLRLGRCDFDFDAAERLLEQGNESGLEAVAGAIEDVFDGIDATHFHLVVHPPASTVFVAPVPGGASPAERNEQLHWEAGQLMDLDEDAFKIVVHPLHSEDHGSNGPVDWFYVTALRRDVYANLVSLLGRARERVVPHFAGSVYAASSVVQAMNPAAAGVAVDQPGTKLLVGQYANHIEYTLCEPDGGFTSCYWNSDGPGDAAYAAAQLVDRSNESLPSLDEVLLYGPAVDEHVTDELTALVSQPPERFNPFEALNVDTGQVEDDFSYWEYVASVGVIL